MKLYVKLLKITFFKSKDTKWIIGVASFVIAMVSMLLTSADSIRASYLQAINQMPQYDFVLEELNFEEKNKYTDINFWQDTVEDIGCSTDIFVLDVPDSPFYFSVTGLTGNIQDIYNLDLQEGHYPENEKEIVVDSKFMDNMEDYYAIGDEITLSAFSPEKKEYFDITYKIAGIFGAKASDGEEVYAFCTIEGAESLLAQTEQNISYRVMVTASDLDKALFYISKDSENLQIRINEAKLDISGEQETDGKGAVKVFQVLGVMIGLVSGALLFNMLQVATGNKIQQIGMLRCLGLDKKQLYKSYLLNLLMYLSGAVLGGFLLSVLLEKTLGKLLFQRFLKGFNMSDYVELSFRVSIEAFSQATALVAVIFILVYFMLLKKSLRYTPVEAVGFIEEGQSNIKVKSKKSDKINVVAFVGKRNLVRNRARTFYTGFTYFVTAILVLILCMVLCSVDLYDIDGLKKSNLFDYEFYDDSLECRLSAEMVENISELEAVEAAECSRRQVYEFYEKEENVGTYNELIQTRVYSDTLFNLICQENGLEYKGHEKEHYYLLLSENNTEEKQMVLYDTGKNKREIYINAVIEKDNYGAGQPLGGKCIIMNQAGADALFADSYCYNVVYIKSASKIECISQVKDYLAANQMQMIYSDLQQMTQDAKTQLGSVICVAIYLMICICAMTVTNIICNINVNVQLRKREYGIL
ncbi:MAG: FtsX-like permease family protein, partial [Lachnospiraceae bacterium]|nr:FtsX-like permease family protein [Lachnospiraceae bacterium]